MGDRGSRDGGQGRAARGAALHLLSLVLDDGVFLGVAAEAPDGPIAALAPPERARAQRLAVQVLRHWDRAGACLSPHLRKAPPARIDRILRLAVVELCQDGAAAHGVVSSAVNLARANRKTAHMSGLVNAVLRRVAREAPALWPELPPQRLPDWLRLPLTGAYGTETMAAIEAVQAEEPPLDLTPRDGDAAGLARAVAGEALPTGSVRLTRRVRVSGLPGYEDGAFWVQDAAAALPARVLAPRPGARVLDLCAAPGGKTLQLAAAGAKVTALDISEPRLARLRANLARTGLSAEIVAADALFWQGAPFDAVLLDAPCSATGTMRRHPDLPFVKATADLAPLLDLQAALIDRAVEMLAPGARLVFCTCSLLPEEGEAQAEAALARHPGLSLDPAAWAQPWAEPGWAGPLGLRLRPDFWRARGGMDGFFITAFRRG